MDKLREVWYLYLIMGAIVSNVFMVAKQYFKINANKEKIDGIQKMVGRWKDEIAQDVHSIDKTLSELKGRFQELSEWLKVNGKGR